MNLMNSLKIHQSSQSKITGIMAEFDVVLQEGTAEHFISWHNSTARPDRQIPQSWYERYLKECGSDGKECGDGKQ